MATKKTPKIPSYKSNEVVLALEIETIVRKGTSATLNFKEKGHDPVVVDRHYLQKYSPKAGGYFVTCEQGCKKYKSKEEFEKNFEAVVEKK